MYHQGKSSNIHHFKGGFWPGASSADIFFLRCYRPVDLKTKILLNVAYLQYLFDFEPKGIGVVFGLDLEFGQFVSGFIQTILKRFFLTLRMSMAATDRPSLLSSVNGPVLKPCLHLLSHDKSLAHHPILVIMILFWGTNTMP
jgi:hypothetical protein